MRIQWIDDVDIAIGYIDIASVYTVVAPYNNWPVVVYESYSAVDIAAVSGRILFVIV